MTIEFHPIGLVETEAEEIPRHYRVSEAEGRLVIDPRYQEGLRDIRPGQYLVVLFHFHLSKPFRPENLIQKPPHGEEWLGVFSTCSPVRPNPLGMSILKVLEVRQNIIRVKNVDMYPGTPILDLKPFVPPKGEESPPDRESGG